METEKRTESVHEGKSMADLGYAFPVIPETRRPLEEVDADFWRSLEGSSGIVREYPVCEGSLFDWDQIKQRGTYGNFRPH